MNQTSVLTVVDAQKVSVINEKCGGKMTFLKWPLGLGECSRAFMRQDNGCSAEEAAHLTFFFFLT